MTTTPPGMTDAAFRTIREFLGLTGDWLAAHLDVSPAPSATGNRANTPSPTASARRWRR